MKKIILLTVAAALCNLSLFAGTSKGTITDSQGNVLKFKQSYSNDMIEYDRYKSKQATNFLVGSVVGFAFVEGGKKIVADKRDRVITHLLQNYSFQKHNEYMSKIIESKSLPEKSKKYIVRLFNSYKVYSEGLTKVFLEKIHEFEKPRITNSNDDLDLYRTPYMNRETIKAWVISHYDDKEVQDEILELIYEYRQYHIWADQDLQKIYSGLL